jgi:hypothetical protein
MEKSGEFALHGFTSRQNFLDTLRIGSCVGPSDVPDLTLKRKIFNANNLT